MKAQYKCYPDEGCGYFYFKNDYMVNLELIDSTNNIWEYGNTEKSITGEDKVFITDTLDSYPTNNISAFKISCNFPYQSEQWGFSANNNPMCILIAFETAIDTDQGQDGGVIEVSFNDSIWYILGDQQTLDYWNPDDYTDPRVSINYPTELDALPCLNKPGISGKYIDDSNPSEGFKYAIKSFPVKNDSVKVYLKFTFCSDSIDNNREGWMIDNLFIYYCRLLPIDNVNNIHNNKIKIFPSPSENKIKIDPINRRFTHSPYEIVNINGQIVRQGLLPNDGAINIATLKKGVYFFKIGKKRVVTKKFIKE